ncbi:MAG: hypothetical protein IJB24_04425 [Clostridia bacterium]|nr:hypothetical protein [Clostridia bacterium]MBQ4602088.1 hypothetical protein [Clostridia bacterium]
MVKINIVYDDHYEDTDIISVPEEIFNNLNTVVNEFMAYLDYAPKDDIDYWVEIDGILCSNLETVGFIKWLNNTYCTGKEKALIIKQHTKYDSRYETIEW